MEYTSINLQGNIVSSEILNRIQTDEHYKYQQSGDFGLDRKTAIRDEIGIAWAATRAHWTAFKLRVDRLKEGESGASETRASWMIPLLRELGYETDKAAAYVNAGTGKSYAISHQATNLADFPIHIMGINDSLDKRREGSGPRLSPHALTQEYLNNTEHTYALVTNGRFLRLLRDATRLVRLSYLEFDLQKMMEEELYTDFAILYRLLHATRMPKQPDRAEESFIEYYHQDSLASGSRIREKLSRAVENSIKELANGFLKHPANEDLREQVRDRQMTPDAYYLLQLRLIYRFLFLIVIEERNLVYPDTKEVELQRRKRIYYDFYSIERLRKLAAKVYFVESRKGDLWENLKAAFLLYEKGYYGEKLGIKPLGSGLFSPVALGVLPHLKLDNATLLQVIRRLTLFENEQKQVVRVNYSDLDVEEFGSVYEGLLEYDAAITDVNGQSVFSFVEGSKRSASGSHYTPEELVQPLIKHSLDYLIADKLKEANNKEAALLSLRVCDPACGSGHILLSAARRVAMELARIRDKADQPSPTAFRTAIRDVIKNCIYGVDINPLAVELCKVALWLEAHNPGEPLGFLDHRIRCGDAIVGLAHYEVLQFGIADEAFKALPRDDKRTSAPLLKRNKQERKEHVKQWNIRFDQNVNNEVQAVIEKYNLFKNLPERNPDEVTAKEKAHWQYEKSVEKIRIQQLAATQVAQFFIPKTTETQSFLLTDGEYRQFLRIAPKGLGLIQSPKVAYAHDVVARDKRFFNWFLEFPDIFVKEGNSSGFDCILGNPPFLGGLKISTNHGADYLNLLHTIYRPTGGTADYVAYFFRRAFDLINMKGFLSFIATNTIAQGDTRSGSLELIIQEGGTINHSVRSMKWPGQAAVEVSLVTATKQKWEGNFVLNGLRVDQITAYLDDSDTTAPPYILEANADKSFIGSYVLGKGFVLTPGEAKKIIDNDPMYQDVIFPYLNGDDLNNNPDQQPSRFVINFSDWPLRRYTNEEWQKLDKKNRDLVRQRINKGTFEPIAPPDYDSKVATDYPICLDIIEKLVKPERSKLNGNPTADDRRKRWWQFARQTLKLYSSIKSKKVVIANSLVSKYCLFTIVPTDIVFSHKNGVFAFDSMDRFTILNSVFHNEWTWKYTSTLGYGINYSVTDCFQNFPFPQNYSQHQENNLIKLEEAYREQQQQMSQFQLGLTKIYNLLHNSKICTISIEEGYWEDNKFEKGFGKEALVLRKHLSKLPEPILTYNEVVLKIQKLRDLHIQMDNHVRDAYGWQDLDLAHDFYEVDYLPENDRIRYTISPAARKEVLKRLLQLNHKLYAEEKAVKLNPPKEEKIQEAQKSNVRPAKVPVVPQPDLFTVTTPLFAHIGKETPVPTSPVLHTAMKKMGLDTGIYTVSDATKLLEIPYNKVLLWFKELITENYEGLSEDQRVDVANRLISFHGLIELYVIGKLRDVNVPMRKILKARHDLKMRTKKVYPFATHNVKDRLRTDGRRIYFYFDGDDNPVTLDGTGQFNLDLIKVFFDAIEFDTEGVALRMFPPRGNRLVVIDPDQQGGKPVVVKKGVTVEKIEGIYKGPQSLPMLAREYNLDSKEVQGALNYAQIPI